MQASFEASKRSFDVLKERPNASKRSFDISQASFEASKRSFDVLKERSSASKRSFCSSAHPFSLGVGLHSGVMIVITQMS